MGHNCVSDATNNLAEAQVHFCENLLANAYTESTLESKVGSSTRLINSCAAALRRLAVHVNRDLHSWSFQSMDDHHRTVGITKNALRVRTQHPAMENCMAALAHDNETGLNNVRLVDDLFRRMAQDNIRFEFNVLFFGALAERDKAALKTLLPFFEDRMKLRALGGFRRPDYSDDEQLGPHIPCHRQGNIQCVLRMWRRVECNQYPLNSDKNRASHALHLPFFCGYWPHNFFLGFLGWLMVGKKMPGKKERVRNNGWNYGAGDDCAHDVGILGLRDDLVIESK